VNTCHLNIVNTCHLNIVNTGIFWFVCRSFGLCFWDCGNIGKTNEVYDESSWNDRNGV